VTVFQARAEDHLYALKASVCLLKSIIALIILTIIADSIIMVVISVSYQPKLITHKLGKIIIWVKNTSVKCIIALVFLH
jgi:hypothetical protein